MLYKGKSLVAMSSPCFITPATAPPIKSITLTSSCKALGDRPVSSSHFLYFHSLPFDALYLQRLSLVPQTYTLIPILRSLQELSLSENLSPSLSLPGWILLPLQLDQKSPLQTGLVLFSSTSQHPVFIFPFSLSKSILFTCLKSFHRK